MRVQTTFWTVLTMVALAGPAAGVIMAQRATVERHVYVKVTDTDSRPVMGLRPGDFVVREDGVAREVLRLSPAPPPTHVAVLVDDTASAGPILKELRDGVQSFVFALTDLPSPPAISIVTFAERPTTVVPYTSSGAALERGIQRVFPRPGGGAYPLDAIIEAAQGLRRATAERPAVVVFVNDASPAFSDVRHTQVADALKGAGASLWTVQLQRPAARTSANEQELGRVLEDVTAWTGGVNVPVQAAQGLGTAFTTLAHAMLGRYDLTYGRPEALIPPTTLVVDVPNRDLRVAAPRWPIP